MSSCKKKSTLYEHKRYIVNLLQILKKNRKTLINDFNNEALHDFRVALRKLLSIDVLSAKTLGFCFDNRLKSKLKSLIKESSILRDIEELLFFEPKMAESLAATREAYQKEFISKLNIANFEVEILHSYHTTYQTLKLEQARIQDFKEAALETIIESISKTAKRFVKILKTQNVNFDELHFVRKRFKSYRYQLDFLFLSANEGSIVCKRAQDKLGKVNDFRVWLEIAKDGKASVRDTIETKLNEALKEVKKEALIFDSKEYCGALGCELRHRMAICY